MATAVPAAPVYERPMGMANMQPTARALRQLSPLTAMLLPAAFIAALAGLSFVQGLGPTVARSMLGAAVFLALWAVVLGVSSARAGRVLYMEVMLFKHHWVQAATQVAIYGFWAWYVPGIRAYWSLLLAQLLFAYGFHILLTWSRRNHYGLGFGPVPITGSFNLFILFKPSWFYLQFGIVAATFLGKELIRWQKDGRSAHIFNPSSFGLVVCSVLLILTGTTDMTFGVEIASWLAYSPNVYVVLFLVSIPVQLLFGVASMTVAAFATMYLYGLAYFALTGTYLFFDTYVPVAVFVGTLLLITDPATSPRTESGRILYGILYGLGIMAAFGLLRMADLPAFYDKLLPVPILNLMVRRIDLAAAEGRFKVLDSSRIARMLGGARRRFAIVGVWGVVFLSILGAGGVGDTHRGQWIPFWQERCDAGSERGCEHLAVMEQVDCLDGSGWACNELGILLAGRLNDPEESVATTRRGCRLGFAAACRNLDVVESDPGAMVSAPPGVEDLPYILRGSKGPLRETDPAVLYALACERGWTETCGRSFLDP